jgi:hypothetical protein
MPWIVGLFDPNDPLRVQIAERVRHSKGGQIRETLTKAGVSRSRKHAVFVPPENIEFWTLHQQCTAQPFFVPATVSAPMINGLQPDGKCPVPSDGWFGYGAYSSSSRAKAFKDEKLCEEAIGLGFGSVVIMESQQQVRVLTCK